MPRAAGGDGHEERGGGETSEHSRPGFSAALAVPLGTLQRRAGVSGDERLALMSLPGASADHPVLSIVVPMFNEEGNVAPLLERIRAIAEALPDRPSYEIVLVNDGSTDGTARAIRSEMQRHPHLVLINLSRNFGHQLAATAGLELACGDAVVLMDGDLQDPPELIATFLEKWREGYDVVYAIRRTRKGESAFKLFTAQVFYRIIKRLTKVAIPVDTGDFRLMSRRVVEALRRSPERHRFLRGMVSWVGFNQIGVEYDRDERLSGTTKYPFTKMLRFAVDGITSFSDIPLRFASYLGFVVSALAFLYALIVIGAKLIRVNPPAYTPGWASTIVAVVFLGGVQLISLGILGEYLGRIYDQVKGRPLYLISDIERS
ncbi:MAG TPA: glycosyltransferase family 2 protein [Candidatus Baltobacteraceae bacterium]|nr:glycosyltransferase family 2 protein [Candidatus Baltobacteraceae bacterium]